MEQIQERQYDAETRKEFADKGWALPDGSFPIADEEDLRNAIQAVGRASDYEAARQHIIKRARALGLTDLLPEDWMSSKESAPSAGESAAFTSEFVLREGTDPKAGRYRMLVIESGLSGNRNHWRPEALRSAAKLLEGRPIYVNHQGERGEAAFQDKVGWWSDAQYVENIQLSNGRMASGIVATANFFENSAYPWLPKLINEALERGVPDLIGISIDAFVKGRVAKGPDGRLFREVEEITKINSADLVAEPGAGGRPITAVTEGICTDEELQMLENLTLEQLREARPDLYEALTAKKEETMSEETKNAAPPADEGAAKEQAPKPAEDPRVTEALSAVDALKKELALKEQAAAIERRLSESRLPKPVADLIRRETESRVLEADELDAIFKRYIDAFNSTASSAERPAFPLGPLAEQVSPLDQVIAALQDWFGAPDDSMKGKYHPIESIRQFYTMLTGDRNIDGYYNPRESVIGDYLGMRLTEALPNQANIIGGSTVTLPNIFGLSMNRALTKMYRGQEKWWEPIVTKSRLTNFKEQQRIIMHQFGSLTQRPVGTEEYTELSYNETQEVFTPTGFGNVVSVGRRAIINDDLESIRRIPTLLAQSATYTINERVASLFTANSGAGVTLADTYTWFNATNHQGNAGTAALSKGSLTAAIKTVAAMTNQAGKRIGWQLRYLLIPIDLIDTAFEITASDRVPGSNNNEPNFIKSKWGIPTENVIVVPQFTDTNNWYALADPRDIQIIEVGFVLGREEPALFVQDSENVGTVFTHDTMMFKVRHEYGMGVLDYRGSYGAIVP